MARLITPWKGKNSRWNFTELIYFTALFYWKNSAHDSGVQIIFLSCRWICVWIQITLCTCWMCAGAVNFRLSATIRTGYFLTDSRGWRIIDGRQSRKRIIVNPMHYENPYRWFWRRIIAERLRVTLGIRMVFYLPGKNWRRQLTSVNTHDAVVHDRQGIKETGLCQFEAASDAILKTCRQISQYNNKVW